MWYIRGTDFDRADVAEKSLEVEGAQSRHPAKVLVQFEAECLCNGRREIRVAGLVVAVAIDG